MVQLAKRFPKFAPVQQRIVSKEVPLDVVRQEIWARRFEFWYRKIGSIPSTMSAAKMELCAVKTALSNPFDIQYMQFAKAFVWFVQIAGCFAIGEMLGRGDMRGYPVGNYPGNPNMPHH
jgi:hypothetical protein